MNQPNIVLTGFMGTGKSAVGRVLAELTGRDLVDTDDLIVARAGREIATIFEEQGEAAFRAMERQVARDLSGRTGLVIASGGRMLLDPLNALLLSREALIYCLAASPQEILARLSVGGRRRPLLEVDRPAERVRDLLAERSEGYAQFSQINTDRRRIRQVAEEIAALVAEAETGDAWRQPPVGRIQVTYPGGRYPVLVGNDLLSRLEGLLAREGIEAGRVVVVTDDNVGPLYAGTLSGLDPLAVITVPSGEENKHLDTIKVIFDQMLVAGLDRSGAVIALGGGVIGDMAGFAAATYMRGVDFIQCPTTVLAMVDASVGGKTGVDLPQGKNLVGAFKQPLAVLADLDTLNSLPPAEYRSGLAEVVKHQLISGQWRVASDQWPDFSLQPSAFSLQCLILEAILVKKDVVETDPFERGRRKILNLGHTFGHAIEQVSGYAVRHGEGVAMGLVATAHLSAALGFAQPELQEEIEAVLSQIGLPARIPPGLAAGDLLAVMGHDKKKAGGRLGFVLIRRPGDVFVSDQVPEAAVRQTLAGLRGSDG